MRRAGRVLFLVALAAYVVSFYLPAFLVVADGSASSEYGYFAFVVSFSALDQEMLGGRAAFGLWLANPAFWGGAFLYARGQPGWALPFGAGAVLLASRLLLDPLVLPGYYVWVAAMALLIVACALHLMPTPREPSEAEHVSWPPCQ